MQSKPNGDSEAQNWLIGGGEMGKLVRSMDWSKTPLGDIASWPQSLRTAVSLSLSSRFPISLAWGPKHVQIYNDGYWPICGAKHPHAMGQDFTECWASAWPVIGDDFERARRGETRFIENERMFLDRHGYLEETCFTFSFSPIHNESGGVGGLFHPVTEVTSTMVGERRIRALQQVMSAASRASSLDECLHLSMQAMAQFDLDISFAILYIVEPDGTAARLSASTGPLPQTLAPPIVSLDPAQSALRLGIWPLNEAVSTNRSCQVDDLEGRFGAFSCGPYPDPPKTAVLLPITLSGSDRPAVVLIAAPSSRLPFDQAYHVFYELLAGTIASAASGACAYAVQRKRAESLAEMDRVKTAFFSNVSHEFRTPLTLMLGPLEDELAETSTPLPPDRYERLQTAHRNSLRLLKLVNTLLDFSRIEAGRIQAQYEPTDLATYTAELASNFRSAMEKGGLSLILDCPPLPESVYVDREMWEKIVLNLLSNAFKHTFAGSIRVNLKWCGETVELAVADTGVGIAESELPHLFERFHRVTNAKSRTHEGTGIGLALVQELVQNHGGTLRAQSQEGHGSIFSATIRTGHSHLPAEAIASSGSLIPRNTGAEAYSEEAARWLPESPASPPALIRPPDVQSPESRPRILWADDNADMRAYVLRLLAEQYDVTAVPDGAVAVRMALADPPDLVLSDVMMPVLDGFGLIQALRADDRTRMIPIILLSARAGEEASLEGIGAGADDYLMKPFSARELLARIGTSLRAARLRKEWMAAIELREQRIAQAAEELRRSNEDLQQFAYAASHDLQEPLRMVTSYVQLLSRRYAGKIDSSADDFISYAVDGCRRMTGMLRDLLDYSRVGAASRPQHQIAAEKALNAALANLQASIRESGAIVTHDALPAVTADETQLMQVFQNLIGNALKYHGHAVPRIHISATSGQGMDRVFSVQDNGLGIAAQHFEKIFLLFQRLHGPNEFSGTGIGLATCKKLVERQGGRIWVESQPEKGSTFFFSVPDAEILDDGQNLASLQSEPREVISGLL